MKKLLVLCLSLIILLCGCGEVQETTSAVSRPVPTAKKLAELSFQVSGYDGVPDEFLLNSYDPAIYYNGLPMERALDTPLTLYINESGNNVLVGFDKLSGVFYNTCDDEKGVHEDCIWTSHGKMVFCGTDRIFFVFYGDDDSAIYSCDFRGENKTKIYSSNYSVEKVVQEGDYLYFLENGVDDNGEVTDCVYRLNLVTLNAELILSQDNLYYFMPMSGKLLYLSPETNQYYIFDPSTGNNSLFSEEDMLPIAFYRNSFYYLQEGFICRRGENGFGKTEYLSDEQSSKLFFVNDSVYRYAYNDGIYKHDLGFAQSEQIFSLKNYKRASVCSVSDEMLVFTYTLGEGSAREVHLVIVDLATKEQIDAILS